MIHLNKIYNEDCLQGMKKIQNNSIDAIICDLPYGTTACSWDTIIPFDKLWKEYERVIKGVSERFRGNHTLSNIFVTINCCLINECF